MAGKTKLALMPFMNDWLQVALCLTGRGLSTTTIPYSGGVFEVTLDFLSQELTLEKSDGWRGAIPLTAMTVADFYGSYKDLLKRAGIEVDFRTLPAEVPDPIPFESDNVHKEYVPKQALTFWLALLNCQRVLERYQTPFTGKTTPVLFWWGSMDLSTIRYSGRPRPGHAGPYRWMELGVPQEYAACGFWPGNALHPEAAFYAYTSPEPSGIRASDLQTPGAGFDEGLGEFLLPYPCVFEAENPDELLGTFFDEAYAAAANLARWNRTELEHPELNALSPR